jgi:hypothetical protein
VIIDYIDTYRDRFGVEPICRVLTEHDVAIAPSTYHARKACPVSDADWDDVPHGEHRAGPVAGEPQPVWGGQAGGGFKQWSRRVD